MKSYKQQLLDYLDHGGGAFQMRFNNSGAHYYAANFYRRDAWEGEFIDKAELATKRLEYRFIIDLSTLCFVQERLGQAKEGQ